jgi:hypothetical protein
MSLAPPDVQKRIHNRAKLSLIDALQHGNRGRPIDKAMIRGDSLFPLPFGFRFSPDPEGVKQGYVVIAV